MRRRNLGMYAEPIFYDGYYGDFGQPTDRYRPTPDQIKETQPEPGKFFRPRDQNSATMATLSLRAYGSGNTANGVVAISNSTWNRSHIRYSAQGYGAYAQHLTNGTGLQKEKKYDSSDPLSVYNSGSHFPCFWIPPLDGRPEPEEFFGWQPPPEEPPPPPEPPPEEPPPPPEPPPEPPPGEPPEPPPEMPPDTEC